jgi:hypothetical protein
MFFRDRYLRTGGDDWVKSGKHHFQWAGILENKLMQKQYTNKELEDIYDYGPETLTIATDGHKNKSIVIQSPRDSAKSTFWTVHSLVWELYRNPNLRITVVSSTSTVAQSFLREIKTHLEQNELLRSELGSLVPIYPERWTNSEIIVDRVARYKDPSIAALGAGGAILSKRADILVCDDILGLANTRTEEQRKKIVDWFGQVLYPILVPGGKIIMVGTIFHEKDLIQEMIRDESNDIRIRYKSVLDEDTHEVLWEQRYTYEYLMERKAKLGTTSFLMAYQNQVLSQETALIKERWVRRAMELGENLPLYNSREEVERRFPGIRITIGVDLQSSQKESSDAFAIVVLGFLKNGTRIVLNLVRLKGLSMSEQEEYIIGQHEKFKSELIFVESNNYQVMIVRDLKEKTALPVVSFTTTKEKNDLDIGVNSLAVLLENEKFIIPTKNDSLQKSENVEYLVNGLISYDPDKHVEDLVMSTWFANNAIRYLESNASGNASVETVETEFNYNSLESDDGESTIYI